MGALLFDVSPSVLVDKFVGKKEQERLINMISRVARVYAPSVIFLDPGEGPWLKKVPPEMRHLKPKRFTKQLEKLIKGIAPGDQVNFQRAKEKLFRSYNSFLTCDFFSPLTSRYRPSPNLYFNLIASYVATFEDSSFVENDCVKGWKFISHRGKTGARVPSWRRADGPFRGTLVIPA